MLYLDERRLVSPEPLMSLVCHQFEPGRCNRRKPRPTDAPRRRAGGDLAESSLLMHEPSSHS